MILTHGINSLNRGECMIDLNFIEPIFVDQISHDDENICYDARLDNVFYKLPAQYKKAVCVRNLQSLDTDVIDTGVTTDDGYDIEMIACVRVDQFIAYSKIIGNDYITDNDHYFAITCGAYDKRLICFVNTNFTAPPSQEYQDGSGLILSQTGNNRIANDVRYPFTSFLASSTTGERNLSSIKIFGKNCKVSIFYCRLKKSGIIVKDYIPCVRISDNVPGFFEKVSKEFVTVQDPSKLEAII